MTMADTDDEHLTLLDPIKDQMRLMALNAIGFGKLCAHAVRLWKFGNKPKRPMQRPLIGYSLLLSKPVQALPVDDLQIL